MLAASVGYLFPALDSKIGHVLIALSDITQMAKCLIIINGIASTFGARDNVVNMENYAVL